MKIAALLPAVSFLCMHSLAVHAELSKNVTRNDLSPSDLKKVLKITTPANDFSKPEKFENMQAGAATSKAAPNRHAFSHPQANLTFADREQFFLGNGIFRKLWVSSPASTQASDGVGPLFNARSCQSCHVKDGRGNLPANGEAASSYLVQLGYFDSKKQSWMTDARYGGQFQTVAVGGHSAEGDVVIRYEDKVIEFSDGEKTSLRKPILSIANLAYGDMQKETQLSPRVAPQMIGMGLLEAIADEDIEVRHDPEDANADGVSGRVSKFVDGATSRIGRFGLKATKPTVLEQSAGAFSNDMGLSSVFHPANSGDCTKAQEKCLSAPHGEQARLGQHEVPLNLLKLVEFYSRNLAPPVRRDVSDPSVLRGKELFYQSGCISCHVPKYVTSRDAEDPQHRFQLIWPYTDMLVHDMGDDLVDGVGHNGGVSGREWRTPPLWGIGLTKVVNPQATYLHDGRARTLLEAVLWHGGEALPAQTLVRSMSAQQRSDLVNFLGSL